MAWRNGAGSTRELAYGTDTDGRLLWRISLASLDGDAPFSVFPGLDRVFVALGPVRLEVDGASHLLRFGEELRFSGEARVRALVGSPTRALNVMTQRGAARASVVLRHARQPAAAVDFIVDLGDVAADIAVDLDGRPEQR